MKNKVRDSKSFLLFLLPSLVGTIVIYLVPLVFSFEPLLRSDIPVLEIYKDMIFNASFRLSILNYFLFIFAGILISLALGLMITIIITDFKKYKEVIITILMVPVIMPSATVAYFFNIIFSNHGYINKVLYYFNFDLHNFINSDMSILILGIIFIWRNIGYSVLIIYTGITFIPDEFFDYAKLEGGNLYHNIKDVILPNIKSSVAILSVVTIINSFRVFRDSYLIFGSYPNKKIYMFQNFLLNQFGSSNFLKLSTASHLFLSVIIVLVLMIFLILKLRGRKDESI